ARGLLPERRPIMLFGHRLPTDSEDEQQLHGDLSATSVNAVIALDDSLGAPEPEPPTTPEAELHYLAGLRTPSGRNDGECSKRQKVLLVEVSSQAMATRTVRVPLAPDGAPRFTVRTWIEEEQDQDEIATQLLGQGGGTDGMPGTSTQLDSVPPFAQSVNGSMGVTEHVFNQLVLTATQGGLMDSEIAERYGSEVLHMVQTQRALLESSGSVADVGLREGQQG
ncbi:unnamed protein product, partial [Symbiodinium sp. CCMP2456]